jgi:hypothetical protein
MGQSGLSRSMEDKSLRHDEEAVENSGCVSDSNTELPYAQ